METFKTWCCFFIILQIGLINAGNSRPKIYPPDLETIIDANSDYTLLCEAQEPVTWTYPNNTGVYWSTITVRVTNISQNKYGAQLIISNASYLDTGYYYCHGNTHDFEDESKSSKIYIYVRDETHLFNSDPTPKVLSVPQHSMITLPCLPTSPDVRVTLFSASGERVPDNEFKFDPRNGFTVNVSSLVLDYQCVFETDEKSDFLLLFVNTFPKTESVAKPFIRTPNYGHTSIGEELEITCTVELETSIPYKLSWEYPNMSTNSRRISESESTRKLPNAVEGKNVLIIKNVQYSDQGTYTCTVKDQAENLNFASVEITVYGKNYSHIKLREENQIHSIDAKIGMNNVQWNINVDAYPPVNLTWYNNKNQIIENSSKYTIRTSTTEAFLKINEVSFQDAGTYKLHAINDKEEKTLMLNLIVKDKPTVEIESENYHIHGEPSYVNCTVVGFPIPDVFWAYKPCQNNKCQFETISPSKYTTAVEGMRVVSILNITAYESGYIKCFANNTEGYDSNTIGFYITDITDVDKGFNVWGIDGGSPVAVGDNLTLNCAASVYNYTSDMSWHMWTENGPGPRITSDDKFRIERNDTPFSYHASLTIHSIKHNESGYYGCMTKSLAFDDEQYRVLAINVQEPTPPRIIQTNMNETEIKIVLGRPTSFFCQAEGIPTPTITWMKDDRDWSVGVNYSRVMLENENKELKFVYTEADDAAVYTCKASNRLGSDSRHTRLTLLMKGEWSAWHIVSVVILAVVFLVLLIVLVLKTQKEKKLRRELKIAGLMNFEKGALENLNPELNIGDQAELLPYDKKWEIPRMNLKLGKQLGSGAFGVVMKAEAYGIVEGEPVTTVAVKMVKRNADYNYIKALASELKIMVHLGKHLNVVNLLGACTKNVAKRELLVIVEYCRFGNLHNYLLRHRDDFINQIDPKTDAIDPSIGAEILNRTLSVGSNRSEGRSVTSAGVDYRQTPNPSSCTTETTACSQTGQDTLILSNNSTQPEWRTNYRGDYKGQVKPISTHDLLCWAFQVARGMEYLVSRKILHGDLAARNILLADDNIVKICDFGLAKDMYKSNNYKKKGDGPLPVKWMAIESIRDRIFSTQSDVWSYGIVLWEFFSLARTPYPGMEADERLYNKLVEGYRMDQPEYANKKMYQLMLDCWNAKPICRPSFTVLAEDLGLMLQEAVRQHYIDLNDPYLQMNTEMFGANSDYLAMLSPPDYGNLSSPSHDYVNEKITDDSGPAESSGYLCMKPSDIFSPRSEDGNVFDFELEKKQKINGETATGVELLPMLHHESDTELSPTSSKSFINPSYQTAPVVQNSSDLKTDTIMPSSDNYVNMPKQKKALKNLNGECFSNPNYVHTNNKIVNESDSQNNYVNSHSRDWERPCV